MADRQPPNPRLGPPWPSIPSPHPPAPYAFIPPAPYVVPPYVNVPPPMSYSPTGYRQPYPPPQNPPTSATPYSPNSAVTPPPSSSTPTLTVATTSTTTSTTAATATTATTNSTPTSVPTSTPTKTPSNSDKKPEEDTKKESIWSEYTSPDGTKYYYNKITKKSQWEKPDELKTKEEKEMETCPWREYTADSGRKYYYNTKTEQTVWEMPEEYKRFLEQTKQKKENEAPKEKSPREIFKELLKEKGMTANWSWEQVMNATKNDARWKLLKMADKKNAYQEYAQELRRQEREQRRKKEEQQRDDFIRMFFEHPEIPKGATYKEAAAVVRDDPRFKAVLSERDREEFYREFQIERERRDREAARKQRAEAMTALKRFLETNPNVTVNTRWSQFKEEMKEHPLFLALEKQDRLQVFIDHMNELFAKEDENYRVFQMNLRKHSRKAREAFRKMLMEKWVNGELTVKSRWREFVQKIKNETCYQDMISAKGSTPAELFYDFIEDLEEKYAKDKKKIKDIMKDNNIKVTQTTTFEEWMMQLNSLEKFTSVEANHLKIIFEDIQDKIRRADERKKKKAIKAFKGALREACKDAKQDTTWSQVRDKVTSEGQELLTESEKEELFAKVMKDISTKREDGDRRAHKKSRRHHRHSSRDRDAEKEQRGTTHKRKRSRSKSASHSRSESRSRSRSRSPLPTSSSQKQEKDQQEQPQLQPQPQQSTVDGSRNNEDELPGMVSKRQKIGQKTTEAKTQSQQRQQQQQFDQEEEGELSTNEK
jgi:pre-mRNA-processing factor 40